MEQTPPQRPGELAEPGFPAPPGRLAGHQGKDGAERAPASGRDSRYIVQQCSASQS